MLHLDISATSSIRGLAGGRAHRRLPCKSTQSVGRGSYLVLWYWIPEWQSLHSCFYIRVLYLLFFTMLFYGKYLCTFENDENVIIWNPINIESLATSLWNLKSWNILMILRYIPKVIHRQLTRTGNSHHKRSTARFRKRYLLYAAHTFNAYMCFAYVRYMACMMMWSAEFVVRLRRKFLPSSVR